uniref:Putative zinc finger protein 91-like n=1 Tax=Davidia involucrata TaxID=16924 RepID=A0A5B6YUF5_DAVIN
MEGDQELRYVCKLCSKRYPSGKSLGGHMRSHVIVNSAESEEKVEHNMKKKVSRNCERESKIELGGHSGYGLRENPKKTWRAVDSTFTSQQEKVCKQCGKGFQSLKALCGHMACHSEKERVLKDDHSWTSENQKPVMDSHSDTQAESPRIVVKSVSGIEQKQEEVAMCLIMLSRDSGNWGGVNSIAESSDIDSVVLETKSSSIDMRISTREGLNCVYNGDENVEIKKLGDRKLKSGVLDSDSGCFRNGAKKVESDVSVDGFLRNDENKMPNLSDAELGKGLNRLKHKRTELRKVVEAGIAANSTNSDSRKRTRNDSELCKNAQKRSKYECQDFTCNVGRKFKPKKSKAHECPICLKVFKSGQALGGHKRSHVLGGSEDKSNQTPEIKKEVPQFRDLLDLNLPAPTEDAQFMPW